MRPIREAYNSSGNFDPELWYISLFEKLPNKFVYNPSDLMERDVSEIKFEYVKDIIKDVKHVRFYEQLDFDDPSEVEKEFSLELFHQDKGMYFTVATKDKVLFIKYDGITIYYSDTPIDEIRQLADDIFNAFPPKKETEQKAKICLIKVYQGDYYTEKKDIKPTVVNIEENYNDDFKRVYDDTVKFLNERCSGLVLFYGQAGSGKTTLIRHLCSTVPKEYIVVPNSIASRLGDPDLTTFITDHTDSVFILEDCEQLLEDRSENPFNNAITTILNMADGLLSDVCNIKFICTFNAAVNKIDPALLRKGRCIAKYEFGKLCKEKVAVLNDKYDLKHEKIEPMTLAEVFNPDSIDYTDKEVNKIGF